MESGSTIQSMYESDSLQLYPKVKNLTYGYIRNIKNNQLSHSTIIPDDIVVVCVLFITSDQFNVRDMDENIKIERYIPPIVTVEAPIADKPLFVYLDNIVSFGRHIWRFKCLSISDKSEGYVMIGIQGYDMNNSDSKYGLCADFCISSVGNSDVWDVLEQNYHYITEFGIYGEDDIIDMIIDFDDGTLEYIINDDDREYLNKSFDIDEGSYRAVISMKEMGDSIQLISYKRVA